MFAFIEAVLTVGAIAELSGFIKKQNNTLYKCIWLLLTIVLVIRYGQGTDYVEYEKMYKYILVTDSLYSNSLAHGEYGWYLLMSLSKRIGMEFEGFIALIGIIMMVMIYKTINRYSNNPIFSLCLLYPTYYLTYFFSAMRQGLAMSLFIYYGLKFLEEKRYINYIFLVLCLSQIHTASLILLVIPICYVLLKLNKVIFVLLSCIITACLYSVGMFSHIMQQYSTSYSEIDISYLAIALRVIVFVIISFQHYIIWNTISLSIINHKKQTEKFLYSIYIIGFLIFIALSPFATLSQRVTMPFKAIEFILIPLQIYIINELKNSRGLGVSILTIKLFNKKRIMALSLLLIIILNVEFVKNIYSYIDQGGYYKWVDFVDYPYITVFNKEDISIYTNTY